MSFPTRDQRAPWPPEVARRYREAGLWTGTSLPDHVLGAAARRPGHTALVDRDRRWTYAELVDVVTRSSAGLRSLLEPHDRVVVHLPNRWEQVVTTLACLRAGVVPLWSLPQHGQHELVAFARHVGARGLVTTASYRDTDTVAVARRVRDRVPDLEHLIVVDNTTADDVVPFTALGKSDPADATGTALPTTDPSDIALMIPSGGTTGAAKIVPRTHDDIVCMLRQATRACGFDHHTRYLAVLPLGHGFPNTGPGVLGTLAAGGTVIISPSPAPATALEILHRERVNATSVVPAVVRRWLDALRDRTAGHARGRDTARPRPGTSRDDGRAGNHDDPPAAGHRPVLIQVGAAQLDPTEAREIERRLGGVVQQVYGMSEGLMCATAPDDTPAVRLTTQGRPVSRWDELRVVDDDGHDVGPEHPGELWTRGPYTVRGYFRSPGSDATSFTPDGWYRTGDIVRRTAEGRIVVVGRVKDVVNRGGETISTREVEELIRGHDAVDRCAVVAMPDHRLGEEVCAYVVPLPGTDPADLADINRHLAAHGLASYKAPRTIIAVDALPMTGIGKVDRRRLRAWLS